MNPLGRRRPRAGRLTITPAIAVGVALALLVCGLVLAVYNENTAIVDKTRQAQVQAAILGASLAAPLAFDDKSVAREYVQAMRANPDVQAVAAYTAGGELVAGYAHPDLALPFRPSLGPPRRNGDDLVVTAPVAQNGTPLGSVYLRVAMERLPRRVTRYLGIGLLVSMGSLLVAGLGAAYASVSEANRRLTEEIAGREKAEEALRQAQKMEAMGQLTGGVAHDFNNLLMVASSGLELMDRTSDPVRRERLKQGIRQAIDRGASLTQQLLAFARRSPMRPEVVDLGVRLGAMGDLLERSLREDIETELVADADLWPVEVDPSQLEVAVLNIALNARDAMPHGGRITISASNEPAAEPGGVDYVRLSIADCGEGMAPDIVARVFEPFFTTKGVGQGTGMGLSQVYGFARSSGGDVRVDSEVGKGTTISLLLPRSAKPVTASEPHAASHRRRQALIRRVLVIEDDVHVSALVGQMLDELGYQPTQVSTAEAGLEMLTREPRFELVLSDMVMPGEMDGLELAREIAVRRPDLPVILTTGYSAAATAAAAEGIRLIVKPYRMETLATEIDAALTGRRSAAGAS